MPQPISLRFGTVRPLAPLLYVLVILLTASCASQRNASHRSGRASTPVAKRTPWKYSPPERPSERRAPQRSAATPAPVGEERVRATIQEARSFIGTPYRWGGTNRTGMDCSGLLVTAFRRGGITLPRTSAAQSKVGQLVGLHQVAAGDLVFFAFRGRKVSHVGLVTEVRGRRDVRFIHSSSSLGVIESNLFSDYYRKNFAKARRPF
ncbi:MAG: C40 family peptidase [Tunicatimonas sp.]